MTTSLRQHYPALFNWRFMTFFAGDFVSQVGNSFNIIALNLLLFSKTQDVAAISAMWIVRTLARLLLQPYLAVVVDRHDRYKIMLATQALNVVVALGFVLVTDQRLWLLYVLVFALQTLDGLFGPAANSLLPQIVRKDELLSANVIDSVGAKVSATLGGVLGAVLYTRYNASTLFLLNALSFLVAFVSLLLIRSSAPPPPERAAVRRAWWTDLAEGLQVVRGMPLVMTIFAIMFTNSLVWRMFEVLIVPLVGKTQLGQSGLGYLYAALTVGGVLGALVSASVVKRFPQAVPVLAVSFALTALPFVALGVTQDGWVYVMAMVISGLLLDVVGVYSVTAIQQAVPNALLGRVFGFQNVAIALGGLPALLALSPLTRTVGYQVPFLLCAAAVLCVGVWIAAQRWGHLPAAAPNSAENP